MELDTVPPEVMSKLSTETIITATKVFESATKAQSNVYTIHGPSSEHELKQSLPKCHNISSNKLDLYTEPGQVIHIHPPNHSTSIVLSGLINNTIIIHNKLNHVLIRKSDNIDLNIKEGTLSGVDILHCRRMLVKMPYHNFTNLEFGEGIYFHAEVNDVSQLHITGSLDVKINDINIPVNPFVNAMFTSNGWFYKRHHEIPKLMICRY